jgi:hypothetical protein
MVAVDGVRFVNELPNFILMIFPVLSVWKTYRPLQSTTGDTKVDDAPPVLIVANTVGVDSMEFPNENVINRLAENE